MKNICQELTFMPSRMGTDYGSFTSVKF